MNQSDSASVSVSSASAAPPAPHAPPAPQPIPKKAALIKTDKPRPHVCPTCTRGFARLEHLKRHERSHTNEKPFQCTACGRCFARRDLLLRHQQKLHATLPAGINIIKKNSQTMAPLIGGSAGQSGGRVAKRKGGQSAQSAQNGILGPPGADVMVGFRSEVAQVAQGAQSGKSVAQSGPNPATEPPNTAFPSSPSAMLSGYAEPPFPDLDAAFLPKQLGPLGPLGPQDCGRRGRHASFSAASALSYTNSKDAQEIHQHRLPQPPKEVGFSTPQLHPACLDFVADLPLLDLDVPTFGQDGTTGTDTFMPDWDTLPGHFAGFSAPQIDQMPGLQHLNSSYIGGGAGFDLSPESDGANGAADGTADATDGPDGPTDTLAQFINPAMLSDESPEMSESCFPAGDAVPRGFVPSPSFSHSSAGSGGSGGSAGGANCGAVGTKQPQRSFSTFSTFSTFGNATASVSSASPVSPGVLPGFVPPVSGMPALSGVFLTPQSVDSPNAASGTSGTSGTSENPTLFPESLAAAIRTRLAEHPTFVHATRPELPSAREIDGAIGLYFRYFDRHLPFVHRPTLQFDEDSAALGIMLAAFGALYRFQPEQSHNLFEASRLCVHMYLEVRKSRMGGAAGGGGAATDTTPLWLVQCLVLSVLYGLLSTDVATANVALRQSVALVALAKCARLHVPPAPHSSGCPIQPAWLHYAEAQSRIRTFHAVHLVSAFLASTYNVAPSLTSNEIACGCPGAEELWRSSNATEWSERVTAFAGNGKEALWLGDGDYFTALRALSVSGSATNAPQTEYSPLTLLSLIYSLHEWIYLHRQRHKLQTAEEPRAVSSALWCRELQPRLEENLRLWETAWAGSSVASLTPTGPGGVLVSDSVPLSSLGYLRLLVDVTGVKESLWLRDWRRLNAEMDSVALNGINGTTNGLYSLREASSHAADVLSLWEKNAVENDFRATQQQTFFHLLHCFFDCAFVISEYVARIELNVAQYVAQVSRLGGTQNQFVPPVVEEDRKVWLRLEKLYNRLETLLTAGIGSGIGNGNGNRNSEETGPISAELEARLCLDDEAVAFLVRRTRMKAGNEPFSLRILRIMQTLLENQAVWPVAQVLAEAVGSRISHIAARQNVAQ